MANCAPPGSVETIEVVKGRFFWRVAVVSHTRTRWLVARAQRSSAPRRRAAVVQDEHSFDVEALSHIAHELVRGRGERAVAIEELCGQGAPVEGTKSQALRATQVSVGVRRTNGSWGLRPSVLRRSVVMVWNGASAGTLNLACFKIGASPVCLKLTTTLPSFTTAGAPKAAMPLGIN